MMAKAPFILLFILDKDECCELRRSRNPSLAGAGRPRKEQQRWQTATAEAAERQIGAKRSAAERNLNGAAAAELCQAAAKFRQGAAEFRRQQAAAAEYRQAAAAARVCQ